MQKIIQTDVELTKEEIFECCRYNSKRSYGGNYAVFYYSFGIMVVCAIVYTYLSESFNPFFVIPALFFALFFILQPSVILPLSIKKTAAQIYKQGEKQARKYTVIITADHVIEVPTEGQHPSYSELNIPISELYTVAETKQFFLFFIDCVNAVILPKRLCDLSVQNQIRDAMGFYNVLNK